jgi:hypothetical protein
LLKLSTGKFLKIASISATKKFSRKKEKKNSLEKILAQAADLARLAAGPRLGKTRPTAHSTACSKAALSWPSDAIRRTSVLLARTKPAQPVKP